MITYLLVAENASLEVVDSAGKRPMDYARENHNTITEQVAAFSRQEPAGAPGNLTSPDIQLFLETFGYVERLDFLTDLRNIKQHINDSLNFVTDELSAESTTDFTDYLTDEADRSRPPSRAK
jgi:hypothetical protein